MLINGSRLSLAVLIFSSALAWVSFLGIIFFVNPKSAGILGVVVLYISLIVGFLSLILILWQLLNRKKN